MAETPQQKKDRLEALAAQKANTAELKEQNRLQREINKEKEKESGFNKSNLNSIKDWSNVLSSILSNEKYSLQEKNKALSINKKIVDLAEKAYTFDVKGLGTTTKSDKIQKQILTNQQNRKTLGLQINRIGEKGSEIQIAANEAIKEQIKGAGKVTAELIKQKEAAEEIEGSKIANTFGVMGNMLGKIPLLSEFAPGFKEAEVAARAAGAEVTLFSKGMMDASDYTMENMAKMGPDAKVEGFFGNTQDEVDKLQKAADNAQNKLKKGGLKKDEVKKLQKTVKKGDDAELGKNKTLYGVAAESALKKGTADLKGVNKTQIEIAAGFDHIGKEVAKMIGLFLIKSLFDANKAVTEIQKGIATSRLEAMQLNVEFNMMADTSNSLLVTHKSLAVALTALNAAYGTAISFNEETLVTSAKILQTKIMDEQATSNLSMMARINGKTLEGSLQSQEDAVNSVNQEHKTRISLRGVLKDANKITGQIAAQLGANPEAIASAVTKAKALGMELKEVAAAGKQMLDFECSIEAELTAELMLGKSLNLEKARLAALTGDYETLTEEINKNVGDFGDFTQMNILQQDALAASMGMSTDALSNQLMKKANLEELAEQALARGDKQSAQDLMALNTQQKFEAAVLKVKDAFLSVMVVVEPLVFAIGFIAEMIGTWPGMLAMGVLGLAALIKFATVFKSLEIGAAIARIWGSAFGKLHPLVAAGVAVAGTAALVMTIAKYSKAGDVSSPADGKTQISTKEGGLFELSKNDDVAAGPGILDKLKGMASGDLSGPTGLFSGGGMGSSANALNNLISIITSKFDLLIQTITEKQGEGNSIQKGTSENLSKKFSTLAKDREYNKGIHNKLAGGLIAASMGVYGMGITTAIASDVMSDEKLIENQEGNNLQTFPMGGEKTITDLYEKLGKIHTALQGKQNINVAVTNSEKYNDFEANKSSNPRGIEQTSTKNESGFN